MSIVSGDIKDKVKLHLGAGSSIIDCWTNVDIISNEARCKKLNRAWDGRELDLIHDLMEPLPYNDDSVDFIFSEHVLEHFTVKDGLVLLRDWHRVLRPGGRLRLAIPSIEGILETYNNPDVLEERCEKTGRKLMPKCKFMNEVFRSYGHLFMYDYEYLSLVLKTIGFQGILKHLPKKSNVIELAGLETRLAGRNSLIESLCVEAIKPKP